MTAEAKKGTQQWNKLSREILESLFYAAVREDSPTAFDLRDEQLVVWEKTPCSRHGVLRRESLGELWMQLSQPQILGYPCPFMVPYKMKNFIPFPQLKFLQQCKLQFSHNLFVLSYVSVFLELEVHEPWNLKQILNYN